MRYVAQAGQIPSPNYTSWATAASNIQDAVAVAAANDVILVSNGVYAAGGAVADGQSNRVYIYNKKITVQAASANPADTLIVGGGTTGADAVRCVFTEGSGADFSLISGFTLTNGRAVSNGGGLRSDRYLTLSNCWVVGCAAATNGGGVNLYLPATVTHCTIRGNEAANEGGGVAGRNAAGWQCPVKDSVVAGNRAGKSGGGLSACVATRSEIVGNTAPRGGGGYYSYAYDSAVSNNVASSGAGGGLYGNMFIASHCVISSNSATYNGGGAWGIKLTNHCLVADNFSGGVGGGAAESLAFDSIFSGNTSALAGGGLSRGSDLGRAYATNCLFVGNRCLNLGGGGQNGGTSVGCVFSNNISQVRGGGASELAATNCLFAGNISTNGTGYGGGLYYGSAVNSRFTGNLAKLGGGAFRSQLINCLVARNAALDNSGAVHGGAMLLNCTVADNTVAKSDGGGAFHQEVYATNCIVWANLQLTDGATNNWITAVANFRFSHCCLTPLPTGAPDGGGNTAVDPRFVDAAGGDYRLRPGSPCVDTGLDLGGLVGTLDLDGQPRFFPAGGAVDIGAFERIPVGTATILAVR